MKTSRRSLLLALALALHGSLAQGAPLSCDSDSLLHIRKSREVRVGGAVEIVDMHTPAAEVGQYLYIPRFHPAADMQDSIPPHVRTRVAERVRALAKDSLSGPELFWALRPFLIWARDIDPHLRAEPNPVTVEGRGSERLRVPGFLSLHIGDTLIVERAADPKFRKGDRIVAIDQVASSEYLQYCYDDRHIYPFTLMSNYHYKIVSASGFDVRVERDGRLLDIATPGMPWEDVYTDLLKQQEFRSHIYPEAATGYFSIGAFYPDNTLLIKKLRKSILNAQKRGCRSFIVDLRGNPGGYGADFDRLLSLFIRKPSVPYLNGQYLQVSELTLRDYDFLADSLIGAKTELPTEYLHTEVRLDGKLFIPGMNYYVLMDRDTGSVAASFCNILQYNGAAELVGEPLRRNALKYGETVDVWFYLSPLMLSCSTVEYDEHTRAVDGVLLPDIAIPYVARDYLSGRDTMLDKLLDIIKQQRSY